jgi:hypothetical protein
MTKTLSANEKTSCSKLPIPRPHALLVVHSNNYAIFKQYIKDYSLTRVSS